MNYGINGADSGTLPSNRISEPYRFGQSLVLPTAGTLVKAGYVFGGWINSTGSTNRFTAYTAASLDVGDPTLFVAWIKTVSFNANGATSGTIPAAKVYISGGSRLSLPTISDMTLRRAGYEFVGWSTTSSGNPVSGPGSYVPLVAQQTLYAKWKVQSTKSSSRIFFNPGKSTLRAAQKLVLRDVVDAVRGKSNITLFLVSNRSKSTPKALGKARNSAVVAYLRSLGVSAVFIRENNVSSTNLKTSPKVNRVTIRSAWENLG